MRLRVIAGRVFVLLILIGAIVIIIRFSDLTDVAVSVFLVLLLYLAEVLGRRG